MVRQAHQPEHPPRLPAGHQRLSGFRRPAAAGRISARRPAPTLLPGVSNSLGKASPTIPSGTNSPPPPRSMPTCVTVTRSCIPPYWGRKGNGIARFWPRLLYHGLRCEELCTKVGAIQQRDGGQGALSAAACPGVAAHYRLPGGLRPCRRPHGLLFRPVKNNRTRTLVKLVHPASVYRTTAERYAEEARSR